jgi:2,3-bisphosphoglycerate-independent phosphoglycerate mutase
MSRSAKGESNGRGFTGPGALIVMDGCGIREEESYNCVALAKTPFLEELRASKCAVPGCERNGRFTDVTSYTELIAVGPRVGMPEGAKGSTAVGHEVLSGVDYVHPMYQIDSAIKDGVLVNPVIDEAIDYAVDHNSSIHLMGLVSNNKEHSHIQHLYSILRRAVQRGAGDIVIHYFSDGRGTPPFSAPRFLEDLRNTAAEIIGKKKVGFRVATIGGRDITMNRSAESWYKTEATFRAIIEGEGPRLDEPEAALKEAYDKGLTDQYVTPTVLGDYKGVENHDVLMHWNFRKDRGEFLMRMLVEPVTVLSDRLRDSADDTYSALKRFKRWEHRPDLHFDTLHIVGLVEYYRGMRCPVAFREPVQDISLGKVLANHKINQYRVSGVDKAKALTLLSGNKVGDPLPGEERITIPLPPEVRRYTKEYDQHKGEPGYKFEPYQKYPRIEIEDLTDRIVELIENGDQDTVVLVNLCNPDMVGHTGDVSAGIQCMMSVDKSLEKIVTALRKKNGFALITADHGNIEEMITPDGEPNTFHTANKVPLFIVGPETQPLRDDATLSDVAPTLLSMLFGRELPEVKKGMKGKLIFANGKKGNGKGRKKK